jgi:polyphosphate kinase
MTSSVHDLFNFLTAYAEKPSYDPLLVAPLHLAEDTVNLISREAEHARAGRPARIIVKVNSLLDRTIIAELYKASQAGVEIDLIVRGMCALNPGIKGVSDRIRVRSIVGRFLEHSRIFYFENGGAPDIYLGSADWMPRNLYERVEVLFPLHDPLIRSRIQEEIIPAYLADNVKARILQRDGEYTRPRLDSRTPQFNAQEFLIKLAEGATDPRAIPQPVKPRRPRVRKTVRQTR